MSTSRWTNQVTRLVVLVAVLAALLAAPAGAESDPPLSGPTADPSSPAAAPSNNNFASGQVVSGAEGSVTGTNVEATKESGEPNHGGNQGGASVWYRWTAPANGSVTIDTVGSGFDTVLGVYTGSSVSALTEVAGNDDSSGLQSSVSFSATGGTRYHIAVDGYSAATGPVVLNWNQPQPPPAATVAVTSPNGGETWAPGSSRPVTWTYTNPPSTATATTQAAADTSPTPEDFDTVAAVAEAEGTVRAIVGLNVGFRPEGQLPPEQANAQRRGIETARNKVLERLAGAPHGVARAFETVPSVVLELSPAAIDRLRNVPQVASIVEDELAAPTLAESSPLVEAPGAWAAGFDGTGQTVAVLDTGVDRAHSFFGGRVVEEACYSANSSCPNGSTTQTGAGAGVPCTYTSSCDHGTHVAGIAAGSSASFSGVGRGAPIMAVQVFSRFDDANCGGSAPCALSYNSDQIAGLERVYLLRTTRSFASVNMSLGGGQFFSNCDDAPQKPAIDNLRSVGIATVIASGNAGFADSMGSPGCISTAVSVGSTTKSDTVSDFSNSASFLSLLAPGSDINSSVFPGGGFGFKNGTSMAAPHVAGAWAVLKQYQPAASVDTILAALQSTGKPVLDTRNNITKPRIRINRALQALDPRVDIHLLKAGSVVATIAEDVPAAAGTFNWAIPAGLTAGTDYRVRVTEVADPRATDTSNANFTIGGTAPRRAVADFDGDGDTDRSIYRPSTGQWFVHGIANGLIQFGSDGDIPVPGDYDGNGLTDRAVYRPSTGQWFVHGIADGYLQFGSPGDVPVPGDYDGNGTTDRAVYRPSTGQWFVHGIAAGLIQFGSTGDVPVPGDYDGNGLTDRAVYRPSTGQWFVHGIAAGLIQYGSTGDIALPLPHAVRRVYFP